MSQGVSVKSLGFWTLTALVAGNMIGSGVFLLPAALGAFGSIGIFAWIVTAIGTMILAIVFSRLSRLLPKTGGPYAYCREAYGEFIGFQVAYNYWIALWVGNAAIIVTLVSYLAVFFPKLNTDPILSVLVSLAFVWFATFINVAGVKEAGRLQIITTILKLIPLLGIATIGLFYIQKHNLMQFNVTGKSNFNALTGAATLTMWAFIGFESATVPAEHVINPRKNIPRATIVGTSIAAVVYLLSTISIMGIIPMQQLAHSTSPFADAASTIFGNWGYWVIAAAAVIACIGTLNGWILMQGQIPLAAAKDGLFPKQFEKVNRAGSPVFGLVFSSLLITALLCLRYGASLVDQFTTISLLATFASLIPYIYTSMAEAMLFIRDKEKFNQKRFTVSFILALLAFGYTFWLIYGAGLEIVFYGVLLLLVVFPFIYFFKLRLLKSNMNKRWQSVSLWTIALVLSLVCRVVFCSENNIQSLTITDRQLGIDKETHAIITKQFVDLKSEKNRQLHLFENQGVTLNTLKHAQLDFIAAQAAIEGNNIALTDAKEALDGTNNSIRRQEKNLQESILLTKNTQEREDKIITIETQLEFLKRLQQLQFDRVKTLIEIKSVAQYRLNLEKNWQQKLQLLYATQQEEEQRNLLSEQLTGLQKQQQDWLNKLNNLTQNLQLLTTTGRSSDVGVKRIHLQILEAEENVALVRMNAYLVHLQDRLQDFQEVHKLSRTTTQLSELSNQAGTVLTQLDSAKEFMSDKVKFLALKKKQLASDHAKGMISSEELYTYSNMFVNLIEEYQKTITNLSTLEDKASYYQRHFKLLLQHHLSERQTFPSDLSGWFSLGQKMVQIPYLLTNALNNFIHQSWDELKTLSSNLITLFIFVIPIILASWFYLRRLLLTFEINIQENKQRFSANVVYMLLELTRRNLGTTFVLALMIVATVTLKIASALFVYILLVYWGFKILLSIAHLTLLENITNISGNDVTLYYRMRSSFILGWLLSTLVVITHNLPVPYEAKICVNRLFMVFILLLGWQSFKVRKSVPKILSAIIHINRRYFYRLFQLLSHLIPIAMISNAIVGLLGYVELAWAVALYQIIFILVLAGYLTARGLLIDALEYISELFIRHVKQGWLWTEAILKPIDRILQIILFVCSCILLMRWYHLDNNEFFMNSVDQLLYQKLLVIGGNEINALVLCQLFIIISMTKWLARWSREFSYRWLYIKAKDVGLRNSLAIFTQYASVIVSILIGLKLLGIDLRGFTVVAAAFAAGIGFGMRDLVINFFSGLLLLIERPFRNGDIVAIGNYEGEVIQTGMRSMTVRTWDNMDVIVPNADMFTKPFVNWTHHDNIVRTVITLKINREDDPYHVQKLILNLLKKHPSITSNPEPEVIMFELSESLIEMQVRYHIILSPQHTRAGVRSEVLFAIWDCFKQYGIRAPHPQYELVLKNSPNHQLQVRSPSSA